MTRLLYTLFMWLAQPLLRRKLARRARAEPLYGQHVGERFGHYSQPAGQGYVWVHAVSLGETRAAAILLAQLRQQLQAREPAMRLLLTHGTATGREEGVRLLHEGDVQVWQPWDTPGAVGRFIAHFRPVVGVLMETEVWPNLVAHCQAAGVPLVLANARLSEKSLRQAQRMAWLARPAFGALHTVLAQTADDARRLQALGARVGGVFGNLKFDATPDPAQLALAARWREALLASSGDSAPRAILLLASSREGEEQMFLDALHALCAADDTALRRVQPMIVPRHPQRFDEVAALATRQGWTVVRRSAWDQGPVGTGDSRTLWLGDSLGEMALYYGLASVALLGGSYAPLGGQNLIEAAACGCPVVMGPHTFNFGDAAAQSITSGAAMRAGDMEQGVRQALALLADAARQHAMAQAATAFTQSHRGASARYARVIAELASRTS